MCYNGNHLYVDHELDPKDLNERMSKIFQYFNLADYVQFNDNQA